MVYIYRKGWEFVQVGKKSVVGKWQASRKENGQHNTVWTVNVHTKHKNIGEKTKTIGKIDQSKECITQSLGSNKGQIL